MAPQGLQLGVLGDAPGAFAFTAQPEPVAVATDPALDLPGDAAARVGVLPFQLVHQQESVQRRAVDVAAGALVDRRPIGICLLYTSDAADE